MPFLIHEYEHGTNSHSSRYINGILENNKVVKERARQRKGSVSNLVESILLDSLYDEPNELTVTAINESRSGKYAGTVDLTDMEAFKKSMGFFSNVQQEGTFL